MISNKASPSNKEQWPCYRVTTGKVSIKECYENVMKGSVQRFGTVYLRIQYNLEKKNIFNTKYNEYANYNILQSWNWSQPVLFINSIYLDMLWC